MSSSSDSASVLSEALLFLHKDEVPWSQSQGESTSRFGYWNQAAEFTQIKLSKLSTTKPVAKTSSFNHKDPVCLQKIPEHPSKIDNYR